MHNIHKMATSTLNETSMLDLLTVGQKFTRPTCGPTTDLSSKPTGCCCFCRSMGQIDRQTD